MTTLSRLVFLVHPFAYRAHAAAPWAGGYLKRELLCAQRWQREIAAMSDDQAVAVITGYPRGSEGMEEVCSLTEAIMGPRAIILRAPDYLHADFWNFADDHEALAYLDDLRDACLHQRIDWNKEEFETGFHGRKCATLLLVTLSERGYRLDPATTLCQAWGEEFEGCAAKYSLTLRRLLGLSKPIEIEYDMTVPGAKFMLGARLVERIALAAKLRLFIFDLRGQPVGLFMATSSALADPAMVVRLPETLARATVRSKPGWRVWPLPVRDGRKDWPFGVHEKMQPLVRAAHGGLEVPVCMGLIYRLAKAPYYVFAPPGMTMSDFTTAMGNATLVAG